MSNARILRFTILTAALCLSIACSAHRPKHLSARLKTPDPATHPATRPAAEVHPFLDTRHGTGSFPLGGSQEIDSTAALAAALHAGYLGRLTPDGPDFLAIKGTLPDLKLLRVDVSDAHMRSDYRPADFAKKTRTERTFTIHRLEYIAEPLHYETASASIHLFADDARLDLLRDDKKVRGLVLAGARRGQFMFHVSAADLNKILTFAPHAGDSSLTVLRTTFTLTSEEPHTLAVDLDVRARWLLLPMTLSLRGRITAAQDGTITFSDLSVTGYDPGGLLAAAFLNPSFHKLNGSSQPIISFPDPHTHVTDVRFSTQQGVTLTVEFARDLK
jgi:hypothetical protein